LRRDASTPSASDSRSGTLLERGHLAHGHEAALSLVGPVMRY
jgi:hypothetical protein